MPSPLLPVSKGNTSGNKTAFIKLFHGVLINVPGTIVHNSLHVIVKEYRLVS